jgi:hypothetical protein
VKNSNLNLKRNSPRFQSNSSTVCTIECEILVSGICPMSNSCRCCPGIYLAQYAMHTGSLLTLSSVQPHPFITHTKGLPLPFPFYPLRHLFKFVLPQLQNYFYQFIYIYSFFAKGQPVSTKF